MVKAINTRVVYDVIEIDFEDGVLARFTPYSHGLGYGVEGLHDLVLQKNGKNIFVLNSRLYRVGPQPTEHKIVKMDNTLTQQKVADYWEEAKRFVTKLFAPKGITNKTDDRYWYQWSVLSHQGWMDLNRLKENKMEILTR